MKQLLTLSMLFFALSLRAQSTSWPSPPVSASVFPIGGLCYGGLTTDSTVWNQQLPALGLNTVFVGSAEVLPGLTKGLTMYPGNFGEFADYASNIREYDFDLAS